MTTAYQLLENHYGLIGKLTGASSLLFWDRNVVMKPGSSPAHAEISGAMAAVIAEKLLDPKIPEWLEQAGTETLTDWQAANLAEIRRTHRHAAAVPAPMQIRLATKAAELNGIWQKARAENNFKLFAPAFAELLELQREIAGLKSAQMNLSPYDAMMDEHDPGTTCEMVDRIFTPLAAALPGILDEVLKKQKSWNILPLAPRHPAAAQRELCEALLKVVGYSFNHGRLDTTTHPFAQAGVPGDVRITTRFKEDDLKFALMGTLHEAGHALYEFNLPAAWSYQPVGCARGAALHESQSLGLEMLACRSPEFIRHLAPMLAERFGPQDPAYGADNLLKDYHRIKRNFIRIEADEVVYPLHVILRYDIERALLGGSLAVADLPEAWNSKMQQMIGVTPPTDTLGCLQDVHWSFGMFGYFPSYAMGAAVASQLFEAATRQDPEILPAIGRGDFKPYYAWFKPKVHEKGSSRSMDTILREATGKPLGADAMLSHLRRRYLG